jgi:hypothetical protein
MQAVLGRTAAARFAAETFSSRKVAFLKVQFWQKRQLKLQAW